MENVGYAALQIIPSMKGFESKLTSGTSGPFGRAGTTGGRLFGNSAGKSITSTVSAHAKKAALIGAAVFGAAGAAAFKLTKDSIAEARDAQKVGALTTSVIKATGGAANVTAKQVGDLAGALSLKTGIDDEVIQSGQNMLLTFKNVRNEVGKGNDIFDQSTKTLIDMSSAMGTEPKQAAIQLGKALNDPIKGITALSRVGVTFTDQQKEQIKALVESGDTMSAQKIILGELKSEFGGAAAAQATMGDKVKTAWGNVEEQLGTALLPLLDKLERWFLQKGIPAIEGWVDTFQKKAVPALKDFGHWITTKGVDKFQDFYDKAKPIVDKTLPAMVDAFDALKPLLKKAGDFAGDMAEQFTKMPKWAQTAIVGGLLVGKAGGFKITASLLGKGLASRAAPMPVIVMNPGFGAAGGATGSIASMTVKNVAKLGLYGLTAAAIIYGLNKGQKDVRHTARTVTTYGVHGAPAGAAHDEDGIDPIVRRQLANHQNLSTTLAIMGKTADDIHAKVTGLSDVLDLVGNKKIHPNLTVPGLAGASQALGKFISQQITAGQPITPYINTSSIQRAIQQINTLNRGLDALPTRGLDNGVPYVHGGTRSSGVNINVGRIETTDPNKFVQWSQQKAQQAGMGGRP